MQIRDILREIKTSDWQPEFIWVSTVEECADLINLPHEDYPIGVDGTCDMIREFSKCGMIRWSDAQNIQKYLFERKTEIALDDGLNLPNLHINLGLRRAEVKVGNWIPPHPMFLQDLIDQVFPVMDTIDLMEWYKIFQTIHPFEDLNGRVGGIILASLSYDGERFLTVKRNTI